MGQIWAGQAKFWSKINCLFYLQFFGHFYSLYFLGSVGPTPPFYRTNAVLIPCRCLLGAPKKERKKVHQRKRAIFVDAFQGHTKGDKHNKEWDTNMTQISAKTRTHSNLKCTENAHSVWCDFGSLRTICDF